MKKIENSSKNITKKEIDLLYKKLEINKNNNKNISDYKLHTNFPTKFLNGKLTMTNSTK